MLAIEILPAYAYISSQLVASGVAPLLAEQKSADRASALLRFVHLDTDVEAHAALPQPLGRATLQRPGLPTASFVTHLPAKGSAEGS
jgi:hypothetical protein